jgi:soluble lytic murein transglycosylase-like protein
MRLGLRNPARLTAGVLMASTVAAAAVVGQHAVPAHAASGTTTVADRIPAAQHAAQPAVAKAAPKAPAKKAAVAKPAAAKPAAAKPAAPAKKTYADNLDGWIAEARDILAADGDKVPSADSIHARAMTESSGNPHAENHWDGNQALYGGTYGLIQTIKPTFAQYSLPGHKDIFNPVDNIIAGVRYANDRYGSFENVAYGKQGY